MRRRFATGVDPSNGKEFYGLLARFVPEWRRWKDMLESAAL
jgi:hypothetical protein